jgi:hypothetical protein
MIQSFIKNFRFSKLNTILNPIVHELDVFFYYYYCGQTSVFIFFRFQLIFLFFSLFNVLILKIFLKKYYLNIFLNKKYDFQNVINIFWENYALVRLRVNEDPTIGLESEMNPYLLLDATAQRPRNHSLKFEHDLMCLWTDIIQRPYPLVFQ